jgi:replicative DNA helicase
VNAASPAPLAILSVEQSLLGSIMASNAAYERVGSFLLPEHFHDPVHAMLYRRMAERIGQGRFVDALILKTELENDRMLEEVGGTAYLAHLLGSMVSIISAGEYGIAIREAWTRREMAELFLEGSKACARSDSLSGSQIAAEAVARLSELAEPTGARPSLSQAAEKLLAEAEAAHQRKAGFERLDVGLPSVDRLLGGLWPGNLYFLMAHPGVGKTTLTMQACRHIARNLADGAHVHLFSLEMPVTDILRISVAAESRWSARQIRSGDIGDDNDWVEFQAVSKAIGELPIIVDDMPTDIAALRFRAKQVHRTKKTRLIVVDHFDLIERDDSRRRMQLAEWVPTLGQTLKNLSKELAVPVLVLRQVNKPSDRQNTRPTRNDLPFDKGQAADEIHAIYRREMDMPDDPPGLATLHSAEKRATAKFEWEEQKRAAKNAAEWLVLKSRFGATGTAHLRFDGPRMLFREAIPTDYGATDEEIDMFTRGET